MADKCLEGIKWNFERTERICVFVLKQKMPVDRPWMFGRFLEMKERWSKDLCNLLVTRIYKPWTQEFVDWTEDSKKRGWDNEFLDLPTSTKSQAFNPFFSESESLWWMIHSEIENPPCLALLEMSFDCSAPFVFGVVATDVGHSLGCCRI